MRVSFILLFIIMLHSIAHANTYELNSPINNLSVTFSLIDGSPHYSLSVDGKMPVKQSKLGLKLDKPFNRKFKVIDISRQEVQMQRLGCTPPGG
jgi:glycosyl hydrolase family 97